MTNIPAGDMQELKWSSSDNFLQRRHLMKLRNFLYLNTKVVEDYISAIDGLTYD